MSRILRASVALLLGDLVAADNLHYNAIRLDNHTHDILVGKRLPAILRFDRDRWLGYDDEILDFSEDPMLVTASEATGTNILWGVLDIRVCTPEEIKEDAFKSIHSMHGVNDKPDCTKANQDVALKYGIIKEGKVPKKFHFNTPKFPKYVYVPPADPKEGPKEFVVYPGSMKDSPAQFKMWVEKLGFKVRSAGSTDEFDSLSEAFVKAATPEDKEKIIAEVEELAGGIKTSNVDGKKVADYYVKIMKKTAETMTGDEDGVQFRYWYQTEYDRMKGVLEKGGDKLTDEKRHDMEWKLAKLKFFEDLTPKEE